MNPEQELLQQLKLVLEMLPGVSKVSIEQHAKKPDHKADVDIHLTQGGRAVRLVAEVRAHGFPRDARAAASLLRIMSMEQSSEFIPLFVAPAITASSRQWLRENEIGYWDSGGSLYLPLSQGIYWIDKPIPKSKPRRTVDLFRGRASQVIHRMLLEPKKSWHVDELARQASVSKSTAHQVLVALEEHCWIDRTGTGPASLRTLKNPGALLDAWKDQYSLAHYDFMRFYRWSRQDIQSQIREIAGLLNQTGHEYALTLSTGALFVAPYVTSVQTVALIASPFTGMSKLLKQGGYSEVDDGETVLVLITDDESPLLFRQYINDVWVASNIQLYLDLSAWPQRGKEQAEHLRQERIGF